GLGLTFGQPVQPRANQPEAGVSPIVRRTIEDARAAPRQTGVVKELLAPRSRGTLLEGVFSSAILERDMPYGIYLPPGYEESDQRYPVLYALHGAAGYYAEWVDFGVDRVADSLFSNSLVPPFIIVFPQGDQSYWFNHPQGGDAWADYVTDEVVPLIDRTYRTIPRRPARAIGGLSMGAVGALQIALRRPDLFAIVGAHSPSFRTTADSELFWYFRDAGHYAQYDPFALARMTDSARRLRIWIDIGDRDPWRGRAYEFHRLLLDRQAPHRWSVGSGIHEGSYWASRMEEYLSFYGYALLTTLPGPGDLMPGLRPSPGLPFPVEPPGDLP
ncbi:MAG: esterase family protein, partial [Dehalococcoidia bacterium]|nr:esterase family protein [Dehalococcoidia bacterium]